MDVVKILVQWGVAGGLLIALYWFLQFLKDERADRAKEREAHEATVKSIVTDFKSYSDQMMDAIRKCTANQAGHR